MRLMTGKRLTVFFEITGVAKVEGMQKNSDMSHMACKRLVVGQKVDNSVDM